VKTRNERRIGRIVMRMRRGMRKRIRIRKGIRIVIRIRSKISQKKKWKRKRDYVRIQITQNIIISWHIMYSYTISLPKEHSPNHVPIKEHYLQNILSPEDSSAPPLSSLSNQLSHLQPQPHCF
jgi:hypothetical protein